jgi:BCD family chlorophyll transporter-like MFS transporter
MLTVLLAGGSLCGFALAARLLTRGHDPCRLSANGALVGVAAFSAVIFASPLESSALFRIGTALIGFGGGLFAVGTLIAAMSIADKHPAGLVIGAWGGMQATAAGLAVAAGGAIRDGVTALATQGTLGPAFNAPATGYSVVYHIEIALLFATLVAIGPLIRISNVARFQSKSKFGLAELPT